MEHEDKSKKITSVHIDAVENGFKYSVHSESEKGYMGMSSRKEYVYESIDEVMDELKDDFGSPHVNVRSDTKAAESEPQQNKNKAKRELSAIASNKSKGGLFKK